MNKLKTHLYFAVISTRFIFAHKWLSLTAVISIALVVVVLSGFLSMARGFEHALSNLGSGKVGLALSSNADTEIGSDINKEEAEILQEIVNKVYASKQEISLESITVVGSDQLIPGTKANVFLRGLVKNFSDLHEGFELVQGRLFTPGIAEIIVGESLYNRFSSVNQIGDKVRLGGVDWEIVGVFKLKGDLFESEVWGSAETIQGYFGRQNQYQSVRIPILNQGAMFDLSLAIAEERRLNLHLQTERDYYEQQSSQLSGLVKYIGWPLALILSVGAICGTFNCLKSAVDVRKNELIILKLLGFSNNVPFIMLMYEAVFFSVAGALLGLVVSFLLFNGLIASTFDDSFNTINYALRMDAKIVVQSFLFALMMGICAGVIPAYLTTKARSS